MRQHLLSAIIIALAAQLGHPGAVIAIAGIAIIAATHPIASIPAMLLRVAPQCCWKPLPREGGALAPAFAPVQYSGAPVLPKHSPLNVPPSLRNRVLML